MCKITSKKAVRQHYNFYISLPNDRLCIYGYLVFIGGWGIFYMYTARTTIWSVMLKVRTSRSRKGNMIYNKVLREILNFDCIFLALIFIFILVLFLFFIFEFDVLIQSQLP